MLAVGRLIAIALVGTVIWSLIKWYVFVIIGIILLLWVIRKGADMFWWGKDNEKW